MGTVISAKSQIKRSGTNIIAILDSNYVLGAIFTTQISVVNGLVSIYYNDMVNPVGSIILFGNGNYFKAGAYIQSNELQGDDLNDFAEVLIYSLRVSHN